MKKEIITLAARKSFQCIGAECSRDCCHGWDYIKIDDVTISKWKTEENVETREVLLSYAYGLDTPEVKLHTDETNKCQALDEKGLCKIQRQLGHDYLPKICREFPRLATGNAYREYQTALFSCPVIMKDVLFDNLNEEPFLEEIEYTETANEVSMEEEKNLYDLDNYLMYVLSLKKYPAGVSLFYVADMFTNFIMQLKSFNLNYEVISQVKENTETFLDDISSANKQGKLQPNPISAGSLWRQIYLLCEQRNVDSKYLEGYTGKLHEAIKSCDESNASFMSIYSVIKEYKKLTKKQIKKQFNPLFQKYIRLIFINSGFPLSKNVDIELNIVNCFINLCVLQLFIWIELNKKKKLTRKFLEECIVEVDRKFVSHYGVLVTLKDYPHMKQIEKYCDCFLDLF